jgi:hypothetical protein
MKIRFKLTPEQSAALEPLREQVMQAFAAGAPGMIIGQAYGYKDGPIDEAVFDFASHEATNEFIVVSERHNMKTAQA